MHEIRVGKENNIFQHIIVLKTNRNKRHKAGEFFVEGVQNINFAIKNGWEIKNWIYGDKSKLSRWATEKINSIKTQENYCFDDVLIKKISGKDDSSELMCIVKMEERKIVLSDNPCILVLDRPSKMGNLGSIIRSCEAFGFDGIIITGHSVDKYSPEVITSAMGSFFSIPIENIETNEEFLNRISQFKSSFPDLQLVATLLDGDYSIDKVDLKKPTILLMGNEGEGLSNFYRQICDVKAKINMRGDADSFNLACATTVFMFELNRQRGLV